MNRAWTTLALALALPVAIGAQPRVYPDGVRNAAGLAPPGLPGAAIARGALISIFGEELGPASPVQWNGPDAPAELGGVSVAVIDSSGATHAAHPVFVGRGQINARMPCAMTLGESRVVVSVNGRSGAPSSPFPTSAENFQMFTRTHKGFGPAAVEHNPDEEGAGFNSLLNPAAPGQLAALWGTGLGACESPEHVAEVQMWVGEKRALFVSHQSWPHEPAVDRIFFQIPGDAPEGCYVPLVVRAGHFYSNFGSIAISRSGLPCADKLNGFTLLTSTAQKRAVSWGRIQLFHGAAVTDRPGVLTFLTSSEQGEAGFRRAGVSDLDEGFHYPVPGTCLVMPYASGTAVSNQSGARLDAGELSLAGPWELTFQYDSSDGVYRRRLSPTPFEGRSGDFIRPNTRYTVTARGGADVGPFVVSTTTPSFLEWTNRDHLPFALARHNPLTVTWSGGDAQREFVVIRGFSRDRETSLGRDFLCTERVEAGRFTLPDSVMASLPPATLDLFVSVGNMPVLAGPNFHAHGLDLGLFSYEMATGKNFSLR